MARIPPKYLKFSREEIHHFWTTLLPDPVAGYEAAYEMTDEQVLHSWRMYNTGDKNWSPAWTAKTAAEMRAAWDRYINKHIDQVTAPPKNSEYTFLP